jgi:hypothetical protein
MAATIIFFVGILFSLQSTIRRQDFNGSTRWLDPGLKEKGPMV